MRTIRKSLLAAAVAALAVPAGAQAQPGELEWFGSVYAKFLDGDRSVQGALYNDASGDPGDFGGDQVQSVFLDGVGVGEVIHLHRPGLTDAPGAAAGLQDGVNGVRGNICFSIQSRSILFSLKFSEASRSALKGCLNP